jgi:hypothetical protein
MKFIKPVDGDMLNNQSGKLCGESLEITVKLAAMPGRNILINGIPAVWSAGEYSARVKLDGYRNTVVALDTGSGNEIKIGIYWLREAAGKYRLSVDDNIWFLQDIARNADKYNSIFNNPYLAMYKSVHDKYGTKVHINIYMECPEFGGFNLTQMPDKFRAEWQANAHWLRLAFHAHQNFPDKPYVAADYATMIKDYDEIIREIKRFAGPEALGPVTTVHWGESTVEGVRALRARGIKALMGYLTFDEKDERLVSYYLNRDQINNANYYGFWKDHSEDIIFGKIDIVLNAHTPDAVPKLLDEAKEKYPEKGFMEFLIHEQYFYPHYEKYLPDYKEIILSAAKWADENGYKPSFVSEVVFE